MKIKSLLVYKKNTNKRGWVRLYKPVHYGFKYWMRKWRQEHHIYYIKTLAIKNRISKIWALLSRQIYAAKLLNTARPTRPRSVILAVFLSPSLCARTERTTLRVCASIRGSGSSLLNIVGHVSARIVIHGFGARARSSSIFVGGHLVAIGHNGGGVGIGLLTADGDTRSHSDVVEAVPCVERIITAALGQ